MSVYDYIIVGGGINSLTAAALLAKKNKSILLLESRDELGGMATLEEFSPGFKCNMVYDYIRWIDPRLFKKLNLYNIIGDWDYSTNLFSCLTTFIKLLLLCVTRVSEIYLLLLIFIP